MVFYRKYRPQKFSELVGQQHVVESILGQLESGKIGHGYLFHGPRGTGKTSTARILAKALNCENAQLTIDKQHLTKNDQMSNVKGQMSKGEPCGKCASCKAITQGSYLDLIEIDAASNRGIDEIRDLREKVKLSPVAGKFKVYIIDEVHMLTTEAFNALLKTLEEPPAHVIFILCTTEQHKLPQTIISRLSRFSFHRAKGTDIIRALEKTAKAEKLEVEQGALLSIAKAADGSYRDALSLLDQAAGSGTKITSKKVENLTKLSGENLVYEFSNLLIGKELKKLVSLLDEVADNVDLQGFNRQLIFIFEEALKTKLGAGEDSPDERLAHLAGKAAFDQLANILKHLLVLEGEMKVYPMPETAMLLMLCKWCGFPQNQSIGEPVSQQIGGSVKQATESVGQPSEPERQIITKPVKLNTDPPTRNTDPPTHRNTDPPTHRPTDPPKHRITGSPVNITLEQVETKWSEFLGKIRPVNAHLVALLRATRPTEIEGDTLYLEVFFRFHKDKLEEPKIMNLLCEKLADTIGQNVKISMKLAQRTTKPTRVVEKSDVAELPPDDLSKMAEEIFLKE